MNVTLHAAEQWEAVYFPNPIPLSSRTLLALALLFDRVHFPGVSIPAAEYTDDEKSRLRTWVAKDPEQAAYKNLSLWAVDQPSLADFVHLPDQGPAAMDVRGLQTHALQLLDDTYGEGTSGIARGMVAIQSLMPPSASTFGIALTWPLYQVRALQHAAQNHLPLLSDDPACIPPLPQHPGTDASAKGLAQQLAVEALSLVLPPLRSVEPNQVAEFRSEVQPLVRPFRQEMVRMSSELSAAITSGSSESDLRTLSRIAAESRVVPALQDLSKQLTDPVKPFHRIAIDLAEVALATASSSLLPSLAVGWAVLRGGKIASEYARLYLDREGKKKSGLAYLLKIHDRYGSTPDQRSEWDKRDWRCSGFVDIPEPGFPLTPENQRLLDGPMKGFQAETVRRLFQTRTMSFVEFVPPKPGDRPQK